MIGFASSNIKAKQTNKLIMEEINKQQKMSIRFFNDKEVRAAWDEQGNRWLFSVVDVISVLTESKNLGKYWSVHERY